VGVPAADYGHNGRRSALAALAPGTALRDGLERILRGNTGALIVRGYDQAVADLCSGGFELNVGFSATRLRELAKMDGAIILDGAGTIVRAAVQLMPDRALPTDEAGTRHRTADRVSRQTGYPVISVSKSMRIITLFAGGTRYVIGDSATILSRAHQALATLERCKLRLNEASGALTALEIDVLVTVRDVISVGQQLEMARRIAAEIEEYMIELGTDSRLLALQLEELATGTDPEQRLLVQDYTPASHDTRSAAVAALGRLHEMSQQALLDAGAVAAVLGLGGPANLDISISPRGYRLLAKVPRLPEPAAGRLVEHFGGLQKIMAATVDELQRLEGVGSSHARSVREGLSRLAESSLLERYS
jgi:diadenylate cyclase